MARVELNWDPFDQSDPGPCIDVAVMNSRDVIEAGRAIGWEYPGPRPMRALLDTGASITVISRIFADSCKLFQTSEGSEITAVGHTLRMRGACGCYKLSWQQVAATGPHTDRFPKARDYAILIGRDVLRNWVINFDGRSKRVTITD
jgi:hypothetical protein